MRLVVIGLGYSAQRFIERHRSRFSAVTGTVRTPEKAAALSAEGLPAVAFGPEAKDPALDEILAGAEALLVSAPPGPKGDPLLQAHAGALARAKGLRWIGYLSTVGVYGDHGGGLVDEGTPPRPSSGRSRARLDAEIAWLGFGERSGTPVQVFRIAGIYGPGRNALANLAEGTAKRIVKPGQVFNRIHVDDIGAALAASLDRPRPGGIYNLADDEPAPPQDVVAYAATLMEVAPPPEIPFDEAELSPMARSFYGENKRVSNRRLREELGVRLLYPTYREGLAALWSEGEGRG
ncbi:MAG TPA: SDR family oxidoreductase [Beijerinckiaceae bacterium]|jgi:nucleoside-diphosphate-sugar epimerase